MNKHGDDATQSPPHEGVRTTALPDDVRFACAYDLHVGPFDAAVAAFFRRTDKKDELWLVSDLGLPLIRSIAAGTASPQRIRRKADFYLECVDAELRTDEESSACLNLLARHFHARSWYGWPERFLAAGMVDKSAYNSLVQRITSEWEQNKRRRERGRLRSSKLRGSWGFSLNPLALVRTIGRPLVRGLVIRSSLAQQRTLLGAPRASAKGGAGELRALVEERKAQRAASSSKRS